MWATGRIRGNMAAPEGQAIRPPCTRSPRRTVSWVTARAVPGSSESLPRAFAGLFGLDLAVARRRVGLQPGQQPAGAVGHLGDRAVERLGIGLRRRVEAGQFAHELQCRGMDLGMGRRRLKIEQRLDVAAHGSLLGPGMLMRRCTNALFSKTV